MADFRGTILTQKGRNLLAKAQAGTTLTFTKIKLGDGLWPSDTDPTQLNDLVSPKLNLPIQEIRVAGDGTVRLRFVLTNTGLSQGFFMREIGIYAQDPDIGEILYAVAYAGDRADFIPADGITKVENVIDIYTVIANAQNVTAVISDTVVLATKQDIDTVKPEAGSTAPALTYPGKLWVGSDSFLKYYNGSSWQDLKVSFADTVDGFHASLTPSPNVIVPLDANSVLDLSPTYIKSNVYTFRRVDLSSATSDYLLQVGEEAYISFSNTTSVPLRIATQSGTYYEAYLVCSNTGGTSGTNGAPILLCPNNTTYTNAFVCAEIFRNSSGSGSSCAAFSAFKCGLRFSNTTMCITNFTQYKNVKGFFDIWGYDLDYPTIVVFSCDWRDTTTAWTSLGTITFPQQTSGYILVRRLA